MKLNLTEKEISLIEATLIIFIDGCGYEKVNIPIKKKAEKLKAKLTQALKERDE